MDNVKRKVTTEPQEWTSVGFLDEFMRVEKTMNDRSFAFILGAGASITSGIPSAATLARKWVEELHRLSVGDGAGPSLEAWATPEGLGIPGFQLPKVAAFYPQVYDRRFGDDLESGYAYLEDAMKSAEPNIGYSILAKVLENTRHRVVITTNFDNLVADALSIYTDTFPLVCGHESLTAFVRSRLRRPLIAKIHRDLLFAPKSDIDGTSKLDEGWAKCLRTLLRDYTPVIIGYGGNDGSLMGLLETLEPGEIQGGLYWCYHRASGKPDERIRRLVARHRGRLVPIVGFDEFMLQLGERFKYKPLADEIEARAKTRTTRYREQLEKFQKGLAGPSQDTEAEEAVKPVREALAATVQREESAWSLELKARSVGDLDRREVVYREGLKRFPNDPNLIGGFAAFMADIRKNYDEAEQLYRRALELSPNHAGNTGNFANFMSNIRKNYDEAERLYCRALELDPNHANNVGNFANFVADIRKDYDKAERLYRRALELNPNHANNVGNFASFMAHARKDYDKAEELYRRALELDPTHAGITGNFAVFVGDIRKDYDKAKRLYRRALELDPTNANNTGNFALFMADRRNYDEAERLYRRALELEPAHANNVGNFARFMMRVRKDYDKAEQLYQQALELDPNNANNIAGFAVFVSDIRQNHDEAERLFRRVFELDPNNAGLLGSFAVFMTDPRGKYNEAEQIFMRAIELDPNNTDNAENFGVFQFIRKRLHEARQQIRKALALNNNEPYASLLCWCLIARAEGRDDAPGLGRLKSILRKGVPRKHWHFAEELQVAKEIVPAEDMPLYYAIADVIGGDKEVKDLDRFERWKRVNQIPLDEPWDTDVL